MRIDVSCPSCLADFNVREQFAGKMVHCKKCGKPVEVPGRVEPLKRFSVSSDEIAVSSRRLPKKSSGSTGNMGLSLGMVVGVGATAVVGLIIVVITMSRGGPPPPVQLPAPITASPARIPSPVELNVTSPAETPTPQPLLQPVAVNDIANVTPTAPLPTVKPQEEPTVVLPLPDLIARVEPAVVRLEVEADDGEGFGSGYIVHADGTAVTNYHVIAGAKAATALFADGTKVDVQGYKLVQPRTDIAVIKLDLGDKKVEPVTIAAALPKKGIDVVGFGAPEGLSFTTSTGIISGIRNSEVMADETGQDLDGTWLQTTCPISSGSSGGPLTDRQGQLIAMNSMGHATGQNLNFAISAVDIAAALTEAPSEFKPLVPKELVAYESSIARKGVAEEIGTPRGSRLLAGLKDVAVVDPLAVFSATVDPQQLISSRIQARARGALEHRNIHVAPPGTKPGAGFGLLLAFLDFDGAAKGRTGTQTLVARSVMLCRDPDVKGRSGKYCIVWKSEEKLGSLSVPLLMHGQIPKNFQFEEKLLKLFNRLEATHRIASTAESRTEPPKETLAKPGPGKSAKTATPGVGF